MYKIKQLLKDKDIVVYLYIIYFLFIGIGSISLKFKNIIISTGGHLFNLSIIIFIIALFYYKKEFFKFIFKEKINKIIIIITFYCFLTIIPLFFRTDLFKQEITYIFQDVLLNAVFIYILTNFLIYKYKDIYKFIFYFLPFIGSLMVLRGIILNYKSLFNINVLNLIEKNVEYHVMFSMIIVMLIPLNIAIIYLLNNKEKLNFIYIFNLIILFIGLILTFSRAGWVAFILISLLSLLIPQLSKKVKIIILSIFFIFLLTIILNPVFKKRFLTLVHYKKNGSIIDRISIWKKSVQVFLKHPIFGIGFSNAIFEKEKIYCKNYVITGKLLPHPHNLILHILVYTGIIGFLLLLYLLYLFFIKILKLNRKKFIQLENKYKIIYYFLILSFISFFIVNLVDTALASPRGFLIFIYFIILLENFYYLEN